MVYLSGNGLHHCDLTFLHIDQPGYEFGLSVMAVRALPYIPQYVSCNVSPRATESHQGRSTFPSSMDLMFGVERSSHESDVPQWAT